MVSKKPTIFVIVGTMLIAWLLVSSIHPIQPTVTAGGTGTTKTSQSSPQISSQKGNSGGGGSNGNFDLLRLPSFNFHFPNLFNIKFPNFNFPWPNFNFHWPTIHWPSFGYGGGSGSGTGSGNGPSQHTGSSGSGSGGGTGGSGGGSGSGQGNAIQTKTTTSLARQPLFTIPRDVLIIIVIIISIIAGAFLALRARNATLIGKKRASPATAMIEPLPPEIFLQENKNSDLMQNGFIIDFAGDEIVSDLKGWGEDSTGFLRPKINEDLPLIWSLDAPLEISAPSGTEFRIGKDTLVSPTTRVEGDNTSTLVTFSEPCNIVQGLNKGILDVKWIRCVRYNEDVMKLFRLNFLIANQEDENKYGTMTPREIVNKITTEKPDLVRDKSSLFPIAKVFERAFYGRKQVSRKEYELYLTSLSKALTKPKVIICGPRANSSHN